MISNETTKIMCFPLLLNKIIKLLKVIYSDDSSYFVSLNIKIMYVLKFDVILDIFSTEVISICGLTLSLFSELT